MSIFSFYCHILRTTAFCYRGRIRAYCQALILRQLLEEGAPEVSPLGHFSFGFHFYPKPILTSPPSELNFRYRGHGEASINDILWSRWLCFNPCRKKFLLIRNLVPRSRIDEVKGEISASASTTRDLRTKLVDSLSVEI